MAMRRVVVTGLGIVSSIGVGKDAVSQALRQAQSGIVLQPDYVERGFRSQVAGTIKIELEDHIDRRALRFMGPPAGYAYIAMQEALADLASKKPTTPRTTASVWSSAPAARR